MLHLLSLLPNLQQIFFQGIPCPCHGIELPEALVHVLQLLENVHFMARLTLFHLSLFDPTGPAPSRDDYGIPLPSVNHSSADHSSESIKKRLPLVEFDDFTKTQGRFTDDGSELVCIICFSCVEGNHLIRELSNCSHVYHAACLDKWVDQGQITCPMCRSNLLPQEHEKKGKKWWVLERIFNFW